eukprot:5339079-Pyramimonas_sp.AAC.1
MQALCRESKTTGGDYYDYRTTETEGRLKGVGRRSHEGVNMAPLGVRMPQGNEKASLDRAGAKTSPPWSLCASVTHRPPPQRMAAEATF